MNEKKRIINRKINGYFHGKKVKTDAKTSPRFQLWKINLLSFSFSKSLKSGKNWRPKWQSVTYYLLIVTQALKCWFFGGRSGTNFLWKKILQWQQKKNPNDHYMKCQQLVQYKQSSGETYKSYVSTMGSKQVAIIHTDLFFSHLVRYHFLAFFKINSHRNWIAVFI